MAGVPFPSLEYESEPTPDDEIVDDSEETAKRNVVFDVASIPSPDFSLDVEPIQTKRRSKSTFVKLHSLYDVFRLAEPQLWHGVMLFCIGCLCVFGCCLFLPEFPVLSNHTLSHPGLLIL